MIDYKKSQELAEGLRAIAKEFNVTFMTATQPPRESNPHDRVRPGQTPDIIIVDYMSLIK